MEIFFFFFSFFGLNGDVFIWGNLWFSSQQKRTRAQTVAAEAQPTTGDRGGADNDRTSDASDQANRESSPDNFEEAQPPKTKRSRLESTSSAADEVSDQSLIGN